MEIIEKQPSTKGPADWFTGDVWFDVIAPIDGRAQGRYNAVHFTPAPAPPGTSTPAANCRTSPKASD